jgi:hypothetical protein
MRIWTVLAAALCAVALVFGYVSCSDDGGGSSGDTDTDTDTDTGSDAEAPILDPSHGGWKNTDCSSCHDLPIEDHTQNDPPQCAACHGGNGACNPNGPQSGHQSHDSGNDCVSCHSEQHGFTDSPECASCHFAFAGTDDCGGDTDTGVDQLIDNCFNWPAEEFSPSNNVGGLSASVVEGQQAVDFTLMDVDGTSFTLSTLLETKPVLLVFGSYT